METETYIPSTPFYKRKSFLVPVVIVFAMALISAATYAYFHQTQIDLTVNEARSSADVDVTLSCYSGETVMHNITIHNSAAINLCANLEYVETSNPNGVTYINDLPMDVNLMPGQDTTVFVQFTCDEVSEAGTVTGTIGYSKIACP